MELRELMHGTPPYLKPSRVGLKSRDPSRGAWRIRTKSGLNDLATWELKKKKNCNLERTQILKEILPWYHFYRRPW